MAFALAVLAASGLGAAIGTIQPPSRRLAKVGRRRYQFPRCVPRGRMCRSILRGLGSVQAFNAVLVRARVDGTLMQFAVTEGQEVKQGDLIAVIDPRPFQAALEAATAKTEQDQADLANAQQDLVRYTDLAQKSFASRQQVDTQRAMVNRMTAMIAGDNAAVTNAKLNLSYCYITSPIEGRIGLRQIDPGNMVHASDATAIVSITQIHPISVLFTLPQDSLPAINAALATGKLPVLAFAADDKTELDLGCC